jgi:hypothetical protein
MVCHVEVQDPTPAMGDHYEDEQHFERDRRHSKEIHRDDVPNMIAQECLPVLGRASREGAQNTRDRSLSDVDAEHPAFTVDPRRAPERILRCHLHK